VSSPSTVPPPAEGGGARYAIAGVALLALAGLGWCLTRPPEAPVTRVEPDAGPVVERSTALVEDSLDIPELVVDTGVPDAGPPPEADPGPRRPRVTTGDWDCSGELSSSAVSNVVRGFDAQIRSCYERRLKANPFLAGAMSLSIKVNTDGAVDGVQVGGSLRDRDVFSCVRGVAMRMRFPRVEGGSCAVVNVPYSFTPRE
jgi:hypothetical protein